MKYSLIALLAFLGIYQSALSQQIPVYPLEYTHPCSLRHTDTLISAPPLSWDMPVQVYQSYFAIDSLCRYNLPMSSYQLRELFESSVTSALMDTLSKYLYITMEYDPVLFYTYLFQSKYLRSNYVVPPHQLFDEYLKHRFILGKKLDTFLSMTAGIYVIEVEDVQDEAVPFSATSLQDVVCITGRVIECIKGGSLMQPAIDPETGGQVNQIKYSYAQDWFTTTWKTDTRIFVDESDTSWTSFGPKKYANVQSPVIGERYLVFVQLDTEPHVDEFGTPINVYLLNGFQHEGGMFAISSGMVVDSSNFFGFGNQTELYVFIDSLNSYIHSRFYHL